MELKEKMLEVEQYQMVMRIKKEAEESAKKEKKE